MRKKTEKGLKKPVAVKEKKVVENKPDPTPEVQTEEVQEELTEESPKPEVLVGFSKEEIDTYEKFINVYSPSVITTDNAKLDKRNGKSIILVSYSEKGIENSMPKFIDGLAVLTE